MKGEKESYYNNYVNGTNIKIVNSGEIRSLEMIERYPYMRGEWLISFFFNCFQEKVDAVDINNNLYKE